MKRWREGFTLIEVVLALGILLIVGATFYQGQTNLLRRGRMIPPTVEWYLMVRELENPAHHFMVDQKAAHDPRTVELTTGLNVERNFFTLHFKKQKGSLVLRSKAGGVITLMTNVRDFHFNKDNVMTVTTNDHATYQARLLLPIREENHVQNATGDDDVIGD